MLAVRKVSRSKALFRKREYLANSSYSSANKTCAYSAIRCSATSFSSSSFPPAPPCGENGTRGFAWDAIERLKGSSGHVANRTAALISDQACFDSCQHNLATRSALGHIDSYNLGRTSYRGLNAGLTLPQSTGRDKQQQYTWGSPPQLAFFSTELKPKDDDDDQATLAVGEKTTVTTPPLMKMTTTTNRPIPSRILGKTPVPTPPSAPEETDPLDQLKQTTTKSVIRKGVDFGMTVVKSIFSFLLKLPGSIFFYLTNPSELRASWHKLKEIAQEEANHYWVGTKLLWADIQTSRNLLNKTLEGNSLTRRERKQLLRTVTDLFRLIPFSMFVLIPFMEFALPFALRLFPNMLPSTYQDSLKAEENMKRELKSRIAMTQFFQETLEELAKAQKRKASARKKELEEAGVDPAEEIEAQKDSAQSMLEFLEKARSGEMVPPDIIIRYANYFSDDLTLDNMPRMQLINMCKYMSIQPYGADSFLRFQLRHKIRVLKEDDQRILWEGITSLTKMELREACQERGMRSTGLSKDSYRRALQQWLDLSVNKDVPIALLIMSRTFFLREETFDPAPADGDGKSLSGLADAISGLDKEILNEVILEVATKEEKLTDKEVRKIKLEVLSQQNELIREEAKALEAATKKKEAAAEKEKEKAESIAAIEAAESDSSVTSSTETNDVAIPESDPLAQAEVTAEAIKTASSVEASVEPEVEEDRKAEDEHTLSAEEMDAISQLISDDPVSKEREELERIKAAMKDGEEDEDTETPSDGLVSQPPEPAPLESKKGEEMDASPPDPPAPPSDPMSSNEADSLAKEHVERLSKEAAIEADASTTVSLDAHTEVIDVEKAPSTDDEEEEAEDPIIARLKKRVESMVDKIEVQLSETQVKIGDKLHYLDKDRDGILTREEMASALQQVLKRKISFDEAMEIANEMDGNQDGVFTVEELIRWIDEHKLVKFVEEGRDADMDRIMESQNTSQQKQEENGGSAADTAEKPLPPSK